MIVSSGTFGLFSSKKETITTDTVVLSDEPEQHTIETWLEEVALKWNPPGPRLAEARFQREAKHWFKNQGIKLRPHVSLAVPAKWRPVISRRKRSREAKERLLAHFKLLIKLLRYLDPVAIKQDYLIVQVSASIHPKEALEMVAMLNLVLPWDDNNYWRVAWWYQRPTSHSTKLYIGFRLIDIMELACEEADIPYRNNEWSYTSRRRRGW